MLGATAPVLVTLALFNCLGASRNPSTNYVSAIEVSSSGTMGPSQKAPVSAMQPVAPKAANRPVAPHAARPPQAPVPSMEPVAQELKVLLVQQNAPPHDEEFAKALIALVGNSEHVHVIVLTLQDLHVMGNDRADVDVINAKSRTMLPADAGGNISELFEAESQFVFQNGDLDYRRIYVKTIPQAGPTFPDCKTIKKGAMNQVNQVGPVALALYVREDVQAEVLKDRVVEIGRAGKTCKGTMLLKAAFMKDGKKFVVVFGSTHGKDGVDEVAMRHRYKTVADGASEATKFANEGEEEGGAAILWGGDFNSRFVHPYPQKEEVRLLNSQPIPILEAVMTNVSRLVPTEAIRDPGGNPPLIMMPMPKIGHSLEAFCTYGRLLGASVEQWCPDAACQCLLDSVRPIHSTAWDALQVRLAADRGLRGLDALIVSNDSTVRGVFYDSFVMCRQQRCGPKDVNLPQLHYESNEATHDVLGIDQSGFLRSHEFALGVGVGWSVIPSGFVPDGTCMPQGTDESLCMAPTFKIKTNKMGAYEYDTGVARPTSWPDRVMYRSGSRTVVTGMSATSENFQSDHRSIVAKFSLQVQ